jgi:hypothetical protein
MQLGRIFDIGMALVVVAGVTVVVSNPNSQGIIKAFGSSFSGSLKAAEGK